LGRRNNKETNAMADMNSNTGVARNRANSWIWWVVGIVAVVIIAFLIWGGQRNNGTSRYDSSPAAGRRITGPNRPSSTTTTPSQGSNQLAPGSTTNDTQGNNTNQAQPSNP